MKNNQTKTNKSTLDTLPTADEINSVANDYRYTDTIQRLGLTYKEAVVYELLLNGGQMGVGSILEKLPFKRGDTYNILYSLRDCGLVEQAVKAGKINFRAKHPAELETYIENKDKELERSKKEIAALMPELTSLFNLSHHQPGVKVFEGEAGLVKLMEDTLTSQGDILSYTNPELVDKYISQENKKYLKTRYEKGIIKKLLVPDTEYNRKWWRESAQPFTEVRFLNVKFPAYATTIQIYNDKLSYQNYQNEAMLGVVIEDKMIVAIERALFENAWNTAGE